MLIWVSTVCINISVKFYVILKANKCRFCLHGIIHHKSQCSRGLQWILGLSLILVLSGDIESNPGPANRGGLDMRRNSSSQPVSSNNYGQDCIGTLSKQRTM